MNGADSTAVAQILAAALALQKGDAPALLAIDGRCGSGKSTLAAWLAHRLGCRIIHMDDFYLPMDRRRPDWTEHPGANMDFARLREETLTPLLAGETAPYRPYVCRQGLLREDPPLPPRPLTILEGSYALHPALGVPFGCKVFLSCAPDCQRRRLRAREGDHFAAFESRWIPLEEGYLAECRPESNCDFVLDTTDWPVLQ